VRVKGTEDTYFLLWTTTPWTLLSNVALAINPSLEYIYAKTEHGTLILVGARKAVITEPYQIIKTIKGAELVGMKYERIFPYMHSDKKAFYVITGDFVSVDEGSGIVHIAPAFGEDDFVMGNQYDLPVFQPVDEKGRFTDEITPYKGLFVKEADPFIIKDLKASGQLYRSEDHLHSYPHCWRCETPLLYYARQSWYIKTTAFKDRLLANNELVWWTPREIGEGRFQQWLKNNVDWSLSRDRFWGTPLNIWICSKCGKRESVGSIEQLRKRSKNEILEPLDLHKPYIDTVVFDCPECGGKMRRTPEVIDCWFDSGSMPYAQWHYPFENKEKFEQQYPADFISEAIDQTRGWFYSLLAISVLLFDRPAYKSCFCMDLILDKDGIKMSKSKGNVVDPQEVMKNEGADALRWYLISNNTPRIPTRFDVEGVREVIRKFFGTLVNTYAFFATYATIDEFVYISNQAVPPAERPEIDLWLLSATARLVESVNICMDTYDITKAARALSDFVIDDLSNWYVRLNRRRFWKSEKGRDKDSAYQTLYETLITVCKLMAPIAPFISEEIYKDLTAPSAQYINSTMSVHLEQYPLPIDLLFARRDEKLLAKMDQIRYVCFLIRSLRNKVGMKIRQPLSEVIIVPQNDEQKKLIASGRDFVLNEVNIREMTFVSDSSELVRRTAKPNFKALGPKLGKDIQSAKDSIAKLSSDQLKEYEQGKPIAIEINGKSYILDEGDIELVSETIPDFEVVQESTITVGINTRLTPELIRGGIAREFVNRVQNMRKEAHFEVIDRIRIYVESPEDIKNAVSQEKAYIARETLAIEIATTFQPGEYEKTMDFDGFTIRVGIERIQKTA
jgi:isoleucyl-tRNA synthetase